MKWPWPKKEYTKLSERSVNMLNGDANDSDYHNLFTVFKYKIDYFSLDLPLNYFLKFGWSFLDINFNCTDTKNVSTYPLIIFSSFYNQNIIEFIIVFIHHYFGKIPDSKLSTRNTWPQCISSRNRNLIMCQVYP